MFEKALRPILITDRYRTYFCGISYTHSHVQKSTFRGKRTTAPWYKYSSSLGNSFVRYTSLSQCRYLCTQQRDQLYTSLCQHLCTQPREQLYTSTSLCQHLCTQQRDQLYTSLCRNLCTQPREQLYTSLCRNLCTQPREQLYTSLCRNLCTQSRDQLYTSLCRHLCTQPREQLYTSLESVKENITYVPVEQCGVKFDLGVVILGDPTHPVALCSHGVPGGAEDFLNLVPALLDMGFRVVLPTYPGFKLSPLPEKDIFRLTHSTVEKADLLKRICAHLEINRVALMVAHSQGTAAAYKFCAEEDVQGAVFLSPCGYVPQQTAQPYWMLQVFAAFLRNPVFQPIFSKILTFLYKKIGFTVTELSHLKAAVQTVASVDFDKNLEYAKAITAKRLPMVFVMSQNDRIVEWQRPFDMLQEIHVPADNIVYYDRAAHPSHQFNTGEDKDWYTRVLVFAKGGHLIHRTQQDLVVGQIKDLVKYVSR